MASPITVAHDTIRLERRYTAAPSEVFAAYADPAARAIWTVPSEAETLVYTDTDFTSGGTDHFICGPRTDPSFVGTTRYEVIEHDALIVCSERICQGDRLLSLSTITWQLAADGNGTRLAVTDQVASLCGPQMVDGSRVGLGAALAHLDRWLAGSPTPAGSDDPMTGGRP